MSLRVFVSASMFSALPSRGMSSDRFTLTSTRGCRPRVVHALVDEVSVGTVGAHHLHDQTRANPMVVPAAMTLRVGHE